FETPVFQSICLYFILWLYYYCQIFLYLLKAKQDILSQKSNMKIVIELNKSNGNQGNGFEIVVYCNHLRVRKQKIIGYSKIEHFNEEMQLINEKHPDYEELLPRLMNLKLKARKIMRKGT